MADTSATFGIAIFCTAARAAAQESARNSIREYTESRFVTAI